MQKNTVCLNKILEFLNISPTLAITTTKSTSKYNAVVALESNAALILNICAKTTPNRVFISDIPKGLLDAIGNDVKNYMDVLAPRNTCEILKKSLADLPKFIIDLRKYACYTSTRDECLNIVRESGRFAYLHYVLPIFKRVDTIDTSPYVNRDTITELITKFESGYHFLDMVEFIKTKHSITSGADVINDTNDETWCGDANSLAEAIVNNVLHAIATTYS
jgi:hypothetical protein